MLYFIAKYSHLYSLQSTFPNAAALKHLMKSIRPRAMYTKLAVTAQAWLWPVLLLAEMHPLYPRFSLTYASL